MAYQCTILRAQNGRRLAKLYRGDPNAAPSDYDAGALFAAQERSFPTFRDFATALGRLRPDECLIRGAVRAAAKADAVEGALMRRLEYDRDDCPAAFEPAMRNWIMLDFDETASPFLPEMPDESVALWRETLPTELQEAESAFFLSASSHRSDTVRGKLLIALAQPLGNSDAEAYAKSVGADGSVCRTVQPNFMAAPLFEGCDDPLAGQRAAFYSSGRPARLPAKAITTATPRQLAQHRDAAPTNLPPLSDRAASLAEAIVGRWLEGNRIEGNAWLHLAGWLLGKEWSKGEIGSMLEVLDTLEPDARKRAEHWHVLSSAVAIDGPGGARDWLGQDDFPTVDRIASHDPIAEAYGARVAERLARANYIAPSSGVDPWEDDTDFTGEDEPLEYACEGLRLAPSRGKISLIGGNAGGGKGPIADHIAVCFALGLKAFGQHECRREKVLLIDFEGRRLTKRRLRRMARAMGHDPAELQGRIAHIDASTTGDATSEASQAAIARRVERDGIGVVIVDSYTTAMLNSGIDSNTPQYALLAQLLGRLGVTVIAVTHAAKAKTEGAPSLQGIAGSGALGALAQTAIMVHYPDEDDRFRVHVSCARAPEKPFDAFYVRFSDLENGGLDVAAVPPAEDVADERPGLAKVRNDLARAGKDADRVEAALREVDVMHAGMTAQKLCRALGLRPAAWAAAVDECVRRGTVVRASLPSDRDVTVRLADGAAAPPAAKFPRVGARATKS